MPPLVAKFLRWATRSPWHTFAAAFAAASGVSLPLLALLEFLGAENQELANGVPAFELTPLLALAIGPLYETLLLAVFLALVRKALARPLYVALLAGVGFGLLHVGNSSLAPVVSGWNFFVWSAFYQHWRPTSWATAFCAAWVPHSLHNALAYALSLYGET